MLDKLPDEINKFIISFLVPIKPKCVMELENYKNLSVLNKEYHRHIINIPDVVRNYISLRNDMHNFKLGHKYLFKNIHYELKCKIDVVLPTNTNEGCLICGKNIPSWWPKIYSIQNNIYPIESNEINKWDIETSGLIGEGVCGKCNRNGILCKICMNTFIIKSLINLSPEWIHKHFEPCPCCSNFKKCKWCGKSIHPLKYLNKEDEMSGYCNLECYGSDRDYLFFASNERDYY